MVTKTLITVLILPFAFVLSTLWSLLRNYLRARQIGLPIIIVPVSPENPFWMLLGKYFVTILKYVPFGNGHFARFCHIGWEFDEKQRAHLEMGDAFTFATPGKNWIYLANADTSHDIIRRERQGVFARPVEMMAVLNVFGPNISTTHGQVWQQHRKATAACFNEKSNALVWTEALRQGYQMLQHWKIAGQDGVQTMTQDIRTLTLDILVHAQFGKSFDFRGHQEQRTTSDTLSYRDALATILENALVILALGPKVLRRLALIPVLGQLSRAADQFEKYMIDMFEEGSQNADSDKAQGNLITSLIRASVADNLMTRAEVISNIFVFSFAGHDTTAHTFAFTIMRLAAHPEVQDWMTEEMHYVLEGDHSQTPGYELFPRFVRTLAVLLETLRLYDPLLSIVKSTEDHSADLIIGHQVINVPADTRLILNLNALHSLPRYWGDDALEWKPSRWIHTDPGAGPIFDREHIVIPEHGAYIPWSEGMRACPGKKFSQVEHVAVMIALFGEHCVAPVRQQGETEEAAKVRALDTLKDTGMMLLLQMFHPERTPLVWRKRV